MRTPYQAYLAADCLPGSDFCKFVSEEVAALTQLEIHRVACQGWHISTMVPSFVVIAELRTSADGFVKRTDFDVHSRRPQTADRAELSDDRVGSYGCTISGCVTPADDRPLSRL